MHSVDGVSGGSQTASGPALSPKPSEATLPGTEGAEASPEAGGPVVQAAQAAKPEARPTTEQPTLFQGFL